MTPLDHGSAFQRSLIAACVAYLTASVLMEAQTTLMVSIPPATEQVLERSKFEVRSIQDKGAVANKAFALGAQTPIFVDSSPPRTFQRSTTCKL